MIGGAPRAGGLLEIADEGIFEICRAALLDEVRRRIGRQHLAGIHQRDAVAAFGFVHEMGRNEDRNASVARQIDQQFPEPVARQRVDARGRLVEDQHFGLMDDRNRKRKPLTDAERQIGGDLVEMVGEPELRDQLAQCRAWPSCAGM